MSFARSLASEFQEAERDELDVSSGCEMSFELSSESISVPSPVSSYAKAAHEVPTITLEPCSPPYKRVRALRLFDSPKTPKTIIKKNTLGASGLRTRLFSGPDRSTPVATAYSTEGKKPAANVNPFTPSGMLLSKKRTRSIRSLVGSPEIAASGPDVDSDMSDVEIEQPTKRLALQESNISRYHQEFVEVELIGFGQFGSVYKCINRLDGCEYAIKKSTKPVAGSFMEKAAMNEVYAHAVLDKHQHVVRYYSAWAEDNHMVIQNEYCNGGSLADKIAEEPLCASELRRLLLHVAEGLRYIHSEGLVHMDIKPGNVFISREKRIQYTNYDSADDGFEDQEEQLGEEELTYKIGDLGHVTSINNPQVEEGDCRYLPSEILHEQYNHLPKADVFALGLTVVEAAGGRPLPKNGVPWHKIRNGELPDVPQTLHRDLIELLQSMIHPDPAERPTAIQVLQHSALSPVGNKSKAQLHRELNAERLKNEILSKQLVEAAKCIKSITPESKQAKNGMMLRLIGKKFNRSASTTSF